MKGIFKNKRIMFPVIVSLIVIAIAILVFIILGIDTGSGKRVSEINLDNTSAANNGGASNTPTNVTNTVDDDGDDEKDNSVGNNTTRDDGDDENDNTVRNNTTSDDDNDDDGDEDEESEVVFGGEKFYLEAAEDFVSGLMNKNDMRSFIDNHLDVKAYIACYNVEGDDSKFMEEYSSLDDDEEKMNEVIDSISKIATESNAKLTALTDPRQSGDSEAINRVTLTVKTDDGTRKIRMVFYQNVVIYIYDENGDAIADVD